MLLVMFEDMLCYALQRQLAMPFEKHVLFYMVKAQHVMLRENYIFEKFDFIFFLKNSAGRGPAKIASTRD